MASARLLKFLACVLLLNLTFFAITDTPSKYSQLSPLAVAALSTDMPIHKNGRSTSLSERQKHELIYKLFATLQQPKKEAGEVGPDTSIKRLLPDLKMFYIKSDIPENKSRHLFSKINRTQTIFGQAVLAHTLACPTTNTDLLLTRQEAVKTLSQNQETAQKL